MRPIDALLARLEDPRPNGRDRWRCRCPSCGGTSKSALSVGVGDNEAVLIRCWKGCEVDEVVAALGLSLHDLFPPRDSSGSPFTRRRLLTAQQCLDVVAFECLLTWTAAVNLANGHALAADDLARLSVASERIQSLSTEVRA